MSYDELELDRIGDRKTAVFFIISDTTQTYNFLVALAFSQMFNLLCERADNVHGGRLPPFFSHRLSESLSLILCGFWDSFFINSPSFLKKGVDKPYKMCGASRP
jgi:hypothetical protein